MEFYRKLKEERIKNELSQEELADKLNISRQSISKWELENGYPNIETLITLSDLFNISIDELIKGDNALKNKIVKEGKAGERQMTDQFKWLYVVNSILAVIWVFVLPWYNLSGLALSIVNLLAVIYIATVIKLVKNNKITLFN